MKQAERSELAIFFFGLFFDSIDGSHILLRNVGLVLRNYLGVYPIR
jgi:hypothetical protein